MWESAQACGFTIIEQLFDKRQVGSRLIRALESLRDNRDEARARNFVGALLRHHHHRSTEYMGRWIEAKNRNSR